MKRAMWRAAACGLTSVGMLVSGISTARAEATAIASMTQVRFLHGATLLPDGRVFAGGGREGAMAVTAEIYDPIADAWTATSPPASAYEWPFAHALCDGRVLLTGQYASNGKDAEIYDPATGAFTPTKEKMERGHVFGTSIAMTNCKVMMVGGYGSNYESEVFDPATGTFFLASNQMSSERFFPALTNLADGRVLVTGGGVNGGGTWTANGTADIFDPGTNSWTKVKNMKHARRSHTATLLPDGRVLVAGGMIGGLSGGGDSGTPVNSVEIYDPVTNTWTDLDATLPEPRGLHSAALMPNGGVYLFGGIDSSLSATNRVDVFIDGAWREAAPLLRDRYLHASVVLPDGSVLISGGVHQATAEIYKLAPNGTTCVDGALCNTGFCVDGVCCESACNTGCRRCDVPGTEGACTLACGDETHAVACEDGSTTCPNETCVSVDCGVLTCGEETGTCKTECTSIEDCAPGYACNAKGKCVAPPPVADANACSTSAPPRSARVPAGGLLLAAGALIAAGRRRIRRRGPPDAGRRST